ncbi:MAG: type II secretion system F family protein [Phycisphaerales bacterium]|nr:type II secretion system F family protein [Phycisphaerales bacterium]
MAVRTLVVVGRDFLRFFAMPNFVYESLTRAGQTRSGVVSAADRADAVRQLMGRGETATTIDLAQPEGKAGGTASRNGHASHRPIVEIEAKKASAFGSILMGRGNPSLSRAEMAQLMRELATALEAGLPLMQSLRTVRKQASGKAMPVILDHFIERVEAGDPLHTAARDYGRPFDDMIVGMLRAADASGKMSEVLHQLADLLERSVELRREVLGATLYPMIVATLIAASAVILITVLVPRLLGPLMEQANFRVPWPTQVLLSLAAFLSSYWIICVIAILGGAMAWRAWVNVPANRFKVDRLKLKSPLFGRLLRDVAVARFTRTLGTLVSAGLPILEALRITRNTLGNTALMDAIDQVQDQVTSGKSLADPLERSGLFPPLLVQVVNLGERSGRLESMLLHAAGAFDRNVATSVKLFTKALPPVLLIVMASLGGFVLAAILLPLLELQSMVR